MFWVVSVTLLCYVITTFLVFLYLKSGKKNIKFHFEKYIFFDKTLEKLNTHIFVRVLADIISKKIFYNKPQTYNYLDEQSFKSLYLQQGSVYTLDFALIHEDMWPWYEKAFSLLQQKINLIIKNKKNLIANKLSDNVYCYDINYNINYDKLSLLNALNINYDYTLNASLYNKFDKLKEIQSCFDYKNKIIVFDNQQKNECKIVLPDITFGYKFKKCKSKVLIYDIFGRQKYSISTTQKITLIRNILITKAPFNATMSICDNELANKLKIIYDYKIVGKSEIFLFLNYLKNLAIRDLNNHLLQNIGLLQNINNEIYYKQLNKMQLKEFIKLANLHKDFSTRYYYILDKIFGLKFCNNKIFCNPNSDFIKDDFALTFVYAKVKSLQYVSKQIKPSKQDVSNIKLRNTCFDERKNIDRYFIEYHWFFCFENTYFCDIICTYGKHFWKYI